MRSQLDQTLGLNTKGTSGSTGESLEGVFPLSEGHRKHVTSKPSDPYFFEKKVENMLSLECRNSLLP